MNPLGSSLRVGGPHFGLMITYPSPGGVERIGADWDWIWIDGQHGEIGYQDTLALVRACDLVHRPAIVRVASHEPGNIGQALDTGASGVIVPLVNCAGEAWNVVQAAKFPPLGQRSFGGRRPIDRFGRLYVENANVDTLLIVQIETPEGLKNVDEIAAVSGVDALFFSGDDMMLRAGCKMNEARPKDDLEADIAEVAMACHRHKKLSCIVSHTPTMLALSRSHGYNLVAGGSDVGLLAASSKQAADRARNFRNGVVDPSPRSTTADGGLIPGEVPGAKRERKSSERF